MNITEEQLLEIQVLAKIEYLYKFRLEVYGKRSAILKELSNYGSGKKYCTNDMVVKKLNEAQEICSAIDSVEVEIHNLVNGDNSLKCISAGIYYIMKQRNVKQLSSFDDAMLRDLIDFLVLKSDVEIKKFETNLDMAMSMSRLFRISVDEYVVEELPEVDELIRSRELSKSKYYKPM